MKYIIIFITTILASCGKVTSQYEIHDWGIYHKPQWYTPPGTISAEMSGYITEYQADANSFNAKLGYSNLVAITYVDNLSQGSQALWGLCETYQEPNGSLTSDILLNSAVNTQLTPTIKKLIIYHEFAHCMLGVGHTTSDNSNVLQIMYPSTGYQQINNENNYKNPEIWNQYLNFMFTQNKLEVSL